MPIPFLSTPCDQDFDCPNSCGALPLVDFSLCSPVVSAGEVTHIYLSSPCNTLIAEQDPNEWAARMALPQSDPSKIITLIGIGEKPAADTEDTQGAYGHIAYGYKHHKIIFTIAETSDNNYNMMRYYEIKKKATAWYKTAGGKTYGGKGLQVKVVLDQVIPLKSSDLEVLTGHIEWRYKIHACRTSSVI